MNVDNCQFNPLIFVPSIRTIKKVWESIDKLPYDKFIVKNHLETTAYQLGHNFFLKHDEYTHIVICPDDLVIDTVNFDMLKSDIIKHGFNNLSGVCVVDEINVDDSNVMYACVPKGADWHEWFRKVKTRNRHQLLPKTIFQAGFTGYACQFINRELAGKLSFTGALDNKKTALDRQMAIEMNELNIPMMVQPNAIFRHMNRNQRKEMMKFVRGNDGSGGTVRFEKY